MRPLCISDYTVTNGLGCGTSEVWTALLSGEVAATPPPFELNFETRCGCIAGELAPLPASLASYDTRQARLALASVEPIASRVRAAVARHGADRVALICGTSNGGIGATEAALALSPEGRLSDPQALHHRHAFDAALRVVAQHVGVQGPCYAVSTACSSSAKAFGCASRLIEAGFCDAVLVGGVDALCELTVRGFHSLGVLSSSASLPFSARRNGIHLGEGAAWVLVEGEAEGPARLLGIGENSDAHSMTAPHPEGLGAIGAMRAALLAAGVESSQVDYVNAHGTGTPLNDKAESLALHEVFGHAVAVSSTKGASGHLLGAAGITELVLSLEAIVQGCTPPSTGADELDPEIDPLARVVLASDEALRAQAPRLALSNSFAFGGNNAALLIGGPE